MRWAGVGGGRAADTRKKTRKTNGPDAQNPKSTFQMALLSMSLLCFIIERALAGTREPGSSARFVGEPMSLSGLAL